MSHPCVACKHRESDDGCKLGHYPPDYQYRLCQDRESGDWSELRSKAEAMKPEPVLVFSEDDWDLLDANGWPGLFGRFCEEAKQHRARVILKGKAVYVTFYVPINVFVRHDKQFGFIASTTWGSGMSLWSGGWHETEEAAREEAHRVTNGGHLQHMTEHHNIDCMIVDKPVTEY